MSSLLNTNDVIKFFSKKEESTEGSFVSVSATKNLQAHARPAKPEHCVFVVHKNDDGTYSFENAAAGGFIASELPSCAVTISSGKPQDIDSIKWKLFGKTSSTHGDLSSTLTQLEYVWLQSVKTSGFLSVRSNEAWSGGEGRLWTRNQNGEPARPQSWEVFQIKLISSSGGSPKNLQEENTALREELRAANTEIEKLKQELAKLEEYKQFFTQFKKLCST